MNHDGVDMGYPGDVGKTTDVDPRVYLRALWRWKWIFLLILVVIPVAAYVVVSRERKIYRSNALIEILPVAGASTGGASSGPNLDAVAALMDTTAVANRAAQRLPPPRVSGASLLGSAAASADGDTGFLIISAEAASPQRAAEIANAFTSAIAVTRARQAVRSLNDAIAEMTQELNSLSLTNTAERSQLTKQIQSDSLERFAQGSNVQVLQRALPVATPVSPHVRNAVLLAVVAGLLLGLVAVVLAEVADRRLRRTEDLEALAGSPTMGVIPSAAFSDKPPTVAEREAFHTLRAALTYFNVDRPLQTVVVASPGKGDGKTTVATQLALACARTGADVILIDADLRHPQVADRLGLRGRVGLASALAGNVALADALVTYELTAARAGRLRVLAGREAPPNPAQLLASQRMRELLDWLPGQVDVAIIDTSPTLMVADSFPLFEAASGTLIVARLNRTHKAAIERLAWTIRNAGGTVLGTVATAAEPRGPAGRYDYGRPHDEPAGAEPPVELEMPASNAASGRKGRLLRRNGSALEPESQSSESGTLS